MRASNRILRNRQLAQKRRSWLPRYLFTGSTTGVWYDPSDINLTWRRNLLTYTEQFDNAAWATFGSLSITANYATSPIDTNTATRIVSSGGTNSRYQVYTYPTSGGQYSFSVWVKATGANSTFRIFVNGDVISSDLTATSTWQRFSITVSSAVSGVNNQGITRDSANNAFDLLVWGAQLEQGSTATPYQRITDGIQDYLQYQAQPVLYRDAAGTLPVTAVEQPVGLMLDKSKGLVLGPELVTNGDFSNGATGWSAGGGALLSVVSGKLRITQPSSTGVWAYQALTTVVGRRYWVSLNFESISGSKFAVFVSTTIGGTETYLATPESVASYKFSFVATATTHYINVQPWTPAIGREAYFDNISVRELPGNHAFNSSGNSANFPVLSARYNLLTKTEQFDDAVWVKDSVTATGGILTASSSGTYRAVRQQYGTVNGTFKYSVRIKAGTSSWVNLAIGDRATAGVDNYFDVQLGVVGSSTKIGSGFDVSAPLEILPADEDGYFLCTVTFTTSLSKAVWLYVCVVDNNGSSSVTAGKTLLVKNASLVPANDALNQPAYQRVNTATDYDTVGFKPYLRFNGTNQWLQTNSIDFTYGDKMFVSAGVRKLSDAARGMLVELSDGAVGSIGFNLAAPNVAAPNYAISAKAGLLTDTVTTYAAPITNVIAAKYDMAGVSVNDCLDVRINGSVPTEVNTGTVGPGNYGNYPLYLGARAGTSLWFNGRLYSLIVAGKLANAVEITETEKYVNGKTAAY